MTIETEPITFRTMLAEARREVQTRRAVFGKRVALGEMDYDEAQWSIALMEAIAKHFEPLAEREQADIEAIIEYNEPRML